MGLNITKGRIEQDNMTGYIEVYLKYLYEGHQLRALTRRHKTFGFKIELLEVQKHSVRVIRTDDITLPSYDNNMRARILYCRVWHGQRIDRKNYGTMIKRNESR